MASTKESSLNLLINTCKDADNQENRSVYDDREKIRYLLESNLTKPNSQSLLITLKWSLYLLESKPAIFVHIHQEHGIHHSDADTRENATQSSQAFTEWFLLHMVHLLSQTNPPVEHARCIDVAIQLLKVIRRRDRYFYRKVLTSFVHFMAGMIKISEALYDDIDHEPIEAKLFLVSQEELRKSFLELEKRERGDIKVTPLSFLIKDVDVCDLIQLNIMKLFQPFASDIFHVSAPLGPLTWTSVCCQLELGDASLKVESLEVIKILLRAGGLVDFNILDYCISCVIALIEVLLIGTLEIDEHLVIALEEKTAEVLCQLKVADLKPLKGISTTLPKNKLVKDIANMLEVNKFTNLKTGKMKQAITDILAYSLFGDCEPVKMMRRRTNLADIDKVLSVLMWQLGKSPRQQYLVGLLSKIICSEFKQTEKPESVQLKAAEESSGTEKSSKLCLQQQRRKRTADGDFKMRETKPLMSHEMVLKKLILFLDSELTEDNCVCVLEAVRAAVEVLCVCAVTTRMELVESRNGSLTLSAWLGPDLCHRLCHWWKKCLRNCLQWNNEVINRCLSVMMQTMGTLLASNDAGDIQPEDLSTFVWILSIVWLPNDPSWLDLKPIDSRDVAKLSNNLSEKIDCKEICDSLRFLSLLPKEVAPKWRVHVLKQACTDSREEVRKAVTNIFPTVLLHLGPNANHLVYELLHPLVLDRDSELQKTVAGVLGYLACVVSRKAVLRRVLPGDNHKPLYEYLKIKCTACDTFDDMEELGSPKGRPKLIDPNMFSPFLVFLQSEDQVTKTEFIQSLKRIFGHIGVRSNNTAIVNMLNSCLVLIEDPNYQVRMEFSEVLQYLVGDLSSDGTSATDQLIVRRLKEAIIRARSEQGKDISLQETIVHTLGQLGRVAESDLLLVVIISLLESLLSEVSLVAATAYKQLQKVAQYKKKSPQILFMKSRQQICRFLVDQIHDAQVQVKGQGTPVKHKPVRILQEVAKVLDFQDIKSFLQVAEKFMVPHLVAKATPEASSLVKMMATHLSLPSRKKLLMNNTKYIFSYLVRSCQKVDLEKAIRYLQNETELELGNLLRIHFQSVHNVLLLHLSSNYMQVFNGLKILSSYDENYKGPKEITTAEQMADFLQPRLLGVLAFFDSQLLNSNITMDEKKLTLEALIAVIKLMGPKHITTIRYKVMNTLRIGLQFKDREFMELSCKAWNSLVRSLEPQFLGQMLSQIIATLLPLSKQLPQAVTEIFNYLIIDNRAAVCDHFHEIYFLPDIPELAKARVELKLYTDDPSSQSDLRTKLAYSLKGVTHESLDVCLHALSKLKQLLRAEREDFCKYVIGNETADSTVSKLISVLLEGCRKSDVRAQNLFSECLGEVGAIDLGRLELTTNNPKEELAKFHASINDSNFAVGLLSEVVKAFLAATEARIQDCSSYALQELLQIYEISEPENSNSESGKIWRRFPEHVQEIFTPLLSTKYILNSTSDWSMLAKPIYGSRKGSNFKDWVTTWTGYLSSKVKDLKAHKVFAACSAVIRHDSHISMYILPYVVACVLQQGSEKDTDEIWCEMKEVLNRSNISDIKHPRDTDFHNISAQTIFSVIDYLTKWKNYQTQINPRNHNESQPGYRAITAFLLRIPHNLLAEVCHSCKAYTRALMHLEQFVSDKEHNVHDHLDFMQRLYVDMDESDGVMGVAAMRQTQPSLMEQTRTHETSGQHQDAQACYEKAIQLEPDNISHHKGLLQSLMQLGQQNKALIHAAGVVAEKPNWASQLNEYGVEAAWKLNNWGKLETLLTTEKSGRRNWAVGVGAVLLAAKLKKEEEFQKQLQILRREQIGPLYAASMESGSYQRGYEYIVRLHMLNEIEDIAGCFNITMDNTVSGEEPSALALLNHWQARLQMTQLSFRTQEPILTLRRTLLSLAQPVTSMDLDSEIGHCWLWSAKIARKAGYLQAAYSSLLQASDYNRTDFFLEKAKLLWEKGDDEQALSCLERGMSVHFPDAQQLKLDTSQQSKEKRQILAQALLLYGRYSEEKSNLESNAIVRQYKEVIEMNSEWEDGHFHLAKYYDRIMTTLIEDKDRPELTRQGDFVLQIVKFFGQSLQYGNQFIYQSMPRLLSLWLDYGTAVVETEKKDRSRSQDPKKLHGLRTTLSKLNKTIDSLGQKLAPYQFFTAFSQLISRICHTQPDVFQQLQQIMARILVQFPQQALWMMMAVSKSSYPMRVKRCHEIFATAKALNSEMNKLIQDSTKLTDKLLELCEKDFPQTTTLSVTQHFRPLKRLLEDSHFSSILLPLQSAMTVSLPNTAGSHFSHNPFPENQVYIRGFEDPIEILPSLQKPKKITMSGSDGHLYVMMCKPKDDLRKDCRLMEFNAIVNKFLRKDPESRKRQLHIRTYTVIPLNEECGLIEWVNNTSGLRHILMKLYKEKGMYTSGRELKAMMPSLQSSIETKLQIYKQKLLPRHPPVFKEWYLRTFPDPTSWYNARLAYARTVAVMSMVGYILGLGDRHGENILFDSTTGDCVHVDFNCLFNKGETFEWPERVPFRLTPNMIDAMGPMGIEGIFRRACEVTLRVMRNQMDPLMSVLRPFVYDPLVEWSKPARGQRPNPSDSGEITNEQALTHVQNIEDRMKGILKNKTKPRGLPLSIEGHVNYLIQEATDDRTNCQMYIGWAAYL